MGQKTDLGNHEEVKGAGGRNTLILGAMQAEYKKGLSFCFEKKCLFLKPGVKNTQFNLSGTMFTPLVDLECMCVNAKAPNRKNFESGLSNFSRVECEKRVYIFREVSFCFLHKIRKKRTANKELLLLLYSTVPTYSK